MVMDISVAVDVGGMQMPMDMPAMIMNMDMAIMSIDPAGDITYSTELVSTEVGESILPEELLAELSTGLEELVGLTGTATMTSRGEVRDVRYDLADASPAAAEQLDQLNRSTQSLSQPLPEEAVGPGARWEVLRRLESNGVEVFDRTVVTLAERVGDELTLELETTQRMADADLSLPDLPPGAEATVAYFKSGGSGEQITQLSSMLPVRGSSTIELEMNVEMVDGESGMQMSMGTEMVMESTITRR